MPATLTAKSVVAELKSLGKDSYKKVMLNHGAKEPIYGVAISELKKIQKRAGGTNHPLALELWDSGVYDAMYLAALLADDARMAARDLQHWVAGANCKTLWEYSVPWVASGSPDGWKQALKWIDSKKEHEAAAGWGTLGCIVAMREDAELDLAQLKKLMARVEKEVRTAPNRVRYVMNAFIIAVGSYVKPLTTEALALAKRLGRIEVDMGDTACKVPDVAEYIGKVKARGNWGKKRKSIKC